MASQGPLTPATFANDAAVGSVAWSSPTNAGSSNDVRATASVNLSQTQYLKGTNAGFSIPASTINGIEVAVERSAGGGSIAGALSDFSVRLCKSGSPVGDNKADTYTGNAWDTGPDDIVTYGGAADLWGTTWTAGEINDTGFGIAFSAQETDGEDESLRVDHITITVYYTEGGASGGPNRLVDPLTGQHIAEVQRSSLIVPLGLSV